MEIKGYLQQRNGKWYYRLKYTDENGKNKDIMRKGGKTKSETAVLMAEKIKEIEDGSIDSNMTFKVCFDLFIRDKKSNGIKLNTEANYMSLYNNYLCKLDNIKMADLRQVHIIKLYTDKQYTNHRIYMLSKCVYKYAYRLGLVKNMSVFDRLEPPKKGKSKLNNMQIEDFKRICEYVYSLKDDYGYYLLYVFIMLSFELGTRRGELCGLTWDNINFRDRCVCIKNNLVTTNGKIYITTPKTQSSIRNIYFTANCEFILKELWAVTSENRLKCEGEYKDSVLGGYDLIFRWQNGDFVRPNYFYYKFIGVQEKLGLRHFKLHDLRHLNASLLINAGLDIKSVQERLGHTDVNTTLNIYSHVLEKKQDRAVNALDNVMKKMLKGV